mgnify:CR=1 FL=1
MSNILTKEDRERWFFLSKRIEYLNGCIASLNTGVRSSGAGQYDRERYGKEIDSVNDCPQPYHKYKEYTT